jgi:GNAT superfamily N-acetyltransferase
MFQVSEVVAPADLDERLDRRGYRLQEPCTTLAKAIAPAPAVASVEIAQSPGDDWLSIYLAGITASRRQIAPSILARVPSPSAFFLLRDRGQPMSAALGVVVGDIVIAECVATLAALRQRGGGVHVMAALESWGASHGARVAALQAVAANTGAQRLYAKLDYAPVSRYHYRVLDK